MCLATRCLAVRHGIFKIWLGNIQNLYPEYSFRLQQLVNKNASLGICSSSDALYAEFTKPYFTKAEVFSTHH
jgi:hypothetical protein